MKILVVELADIGDLVLTTPALGALRRSFPNAQIDILTTKHAAPILNGTGLVDQVILFDKFIFDSPRALLKVGNMRLLYQLARKLRAQHYDAVLIFHRLTTRFGALKYAGLGLATGARQRLGVDNGRGWFLTKRVVDHGFGAKHQARYWLEVAGLLGAAIDGENRLQIGIGEADRAWAQAQLPDHPHLIAIHPGSGGFSLARRWESEKFAQLADRLIENGTQVVIVGGKNDNAEAVIQAMQHTPLNLSKQTTLNQLAAVLERCERYYGADAGVLHIAAAVGIPVTAIYGPTNVNAYGPFTEQRTIVQSGARCSPCAYIGNTVGLREGCTARTCLKTVTVEMVLNPPTPTVNTVQAKPPNLQILGLPVHQITFAGLLDQIGEWVSDSRAHQICTINPEFIMMAQRDILFYTVLQRADLCVADGVGLLLAARFMRQPLPERVTGSDGVPLICERAAREGWKIFFLGAASGVAQQAAEILRAKHPALQIVGVHAGSPAADEEDSIVELINQSGAQILFVAYGAPNQDKWIARNLHRFTSVRIAIGVGGSFDFIAGVAKRAPLWMRRAGIEWLYRLITQPWRWKRMTRLPRFVLAVFVRGSRAPAKFETPD
jgi:lipopolysaccharide heptosyltransferase II